MLITIEFPRAGDGGTRCEVHQLSRVPMTGEGITIPTFDRVWTVARVTHLADVPTGSAVAFIQVR